MSRILPEPTFRLLLPFIAEETSAKPSLVTWLHGQQSPFTGCPETQGSAIGLRTPTGFTTGPPSVPRSFTHWDTLTTPLPVPLLAAFPGKTPFRLIAADVPCSGLLYPVPRKSPTQLFSTAIQDCSGLQSTATSYWYSGTAT